MKNFGDIKIHGATIKKTLTKVKYRISTRQFRSTYIEPL
jgi:hypothetical protein